jgi:hypothetical protein
VRVGPAFVVAPYRSYLYRPPFSLSFSYGYPGYYAYPGYYGYPAPYAYPYAGYGYPGAAVSAGYGYGGVRIRVTPSDATVYVDGYYVGIVDDFNGTLQRLALEAGPHRIEIRSPGYETLIFDVRIDPNQTITCRGTMQPVQP